MALFGSLASLQAQAPRTAGFATAFAYAAELLREGSPVQARIRQTAVGEVGKHELGGGVFVVEQVYQTKTRPEVFFETHRTYIDLQVMLEGTEVMELADCARLMIRQPYNPERDLVIYDDTTDASRLRLLPGLAAIYFPSDAHMGSLRVTSEAALVRKAVVKIPVSA